MNKLKIIIFLASIAIFSGCKEESNPTPQSNNNNSTSSTIDQLLPGSWAITGVEQKNGVITWDGITMATFSGVGKDINGTMKFTENPNNFTSDIIYTMTLTTVVQGVEQVDEQQLEGHTTGTWKALPNGSVELTNTGQSQSEVQQVVSKSSNKVVFKFVYADVQVVNDITVARSVDVFTTIER